MKAFAIHCWKNRLQFPLRWNCIPLARIAFGFFFSSNRACYCCWTRKDSSDYHFFPFSKAISKRFKVMWDFVSFGDFRFILMLVAGDWNASNCQITRAIALRLANINCNWTWLHWRCDVIRMWKRCTLQWSLKLIIFSMFANQCRQRVDL